MEFRKAYSAQALEGSNIPKVIPSAACFSIATNYLLVAAKETAVKAWRTHSTQQQCSTSLEDGSHP